MSKMFARRKTWGRLARNAERIEGRADPSPCFVRPNIARLDFASPPPAPRAPQPWGIVELCLLDSALVGRVRVVVSIDFFSAS